MAELANVSIATVSRVLNGSGYVSPELEQRVRQAVADLDYDLNVQWRHPHEELTIGVLVPGGNPFFEEVVRGVEEVADERGVRVVMCHTGLDSLRAAGYANILRQHRITGFVVISPDNVAQHWQRLLDQNFPLVLVDRSVDGIDADTVVSDNHGGAAAAVSHLITLGHRRIGFVTGLLHMESARARLAGAKDTLVQAGIPFEPSLVYDKGDFLSTSGYAGAETLFSNPEPPTAIFAFNDLMALGVLYCAYAHGIAVPQQLSVVGFDDIALSAYFVPGLTTVSQPKYELGRNVAEILLERIEGNRDPRIHQILPTKLVVRESTAPPGSMNDVAGADDDPSGRTHVVA
ncbi:MAG TPA: LacI family DNA-binding transcriptional regulator [Aggregatilineales bacterium]|nr:LacI family DNA-binding transcriptional regulator [Aggregatilineales bacterium]